MLRFILKSAAIYINPMFTYYLIKVAWGGDTHVCARVAINLMLRGCQILCCGIAKIRKGLKTVKIRISVHTTKIEVN